MAVGNTRPPRALTDEQLLTRFEGGDRDCVDELFRRHRSAAFRVAYRLLGNETDALDAVQEGFVKVLTHLNSFQGRSSFKTWLLRVVSNAALDLGRQRGRRAAQITDRPPGDDPDRGGGHLAGIPGAPDDPARGLEQADLRRLLDEALATLPEAQRRTFVLHAEAGLSYREAADVLQISIGTVMSRLYYARQKLRSYLAQRIPV